jgi:hypothetical protein
MRFFTFVWRLILFLTVTSLPFVATGFAFWQLRGAIVALATFGLLVFAAVLRTERGILRVYRVRPEEPEGVGRSLERVLARLGGSVPRVFSFGDPAPQVLVVRGLFGPGSILLSEGVLGALTEEELRELLTAGVLRLRSRGIVFQSLCAWIAHRMLEFAPRSWVELLFGELRWHEKLGVFGALRFVVAYTAAKFFVGLGRTSNNAPRALARLPVVGGEVVNPGSSILHFSAPWAERSLLVL